MKYKPGDEVKAKNYHVEGFPWQLARFENYRPDLDRYIVQFDGETRRVLLRSCDIRPRREAEANAT